MVEHVERFGAELKGVSLLDGEVLEQRHVEVRATRIAQVVPSGRSEGQSRRHRKRIRVVANLYSGRRDSLGGGMFGVGIADQVRIRPGADTVADARIVAICRRRW